MSARQEPNAPIFLTLSINTSLSKVNNKYFMIKELQLV